MNASVTTCVLRYQQIHSGLILHNVVLSQMLLRNQQITVKLLFVLSYNVP